MNTVPASLEGAAEGDSLLPEFMVARQRFQHAARADLCAWIDKEIAGYGQTRRVPAYRWVPAVAHGTVSMADGSILNDHRLPVSNLSEEWTRERVRQGLAEIEALVFSGETCVAHDIPQGDLAIFSRGLGLRGARITRAWWTIRTSDLKTVVLDGARAELHHLLACLPAGHDKP